MNTTRNKAKSENMLVYGLLFLILMQLASTVAVILFKGNGWIVPSDLANCWSCSVYYLRGYTFAEALANPLPGVSAPTNLIIMPWGGLLYQILFPGFLPFHVVVLWYYALLFAASLVFFFHLKKWISVNCSVSGEGKLTVFALGALFIPWFWWDAAYAGNPGTVMAILGGLSFFHLKKHPNAAAVCLAFSLLKPQVGALFLLACFLMRYYGVLIKCGGILGLSWMIGGLFTRNVRELNGLPTQEKQGGIEVIRGILLERFQSGDMQLESDDVAHLYYGLFDPLRSVGVSVLTVLLLSALAGAAYVIFCFLKLKKKETVVNPVVLGTTTVLASLFWTYKSLSDAIVIAMCNAFLMIVYLKDDERNMKKLILLLAGLALMNCKVVKYFIRFSLGLPHTIGITGDMILQILVFTSYFMAYINSSCLIRGIEND